jgi:hypothetical protein
MIAIGKEQSNIFCSGTSGAERSVRLTLAGGSGGRLIGQSFTIRFHRGQTQLKVVEQRLERSRTTHEL